MAPRRKSTAKHGKEVAGPQAEQAATQQSDLQSPDLLSFENLRTCLDSADAINAGFQVQEAIARHNEGCSHAHEESTSAATQSLNRVHIHEATPCDYTQEEPAPCDDTHGEYSFYIEDDGKECPHTQGQKLQDRDANVKMIEQTYVRLVAAPRGPFLTNSWVLTWHRELAQCDIFEVFEALGPVRAEWFGRVLKAMEGDESKLVGTYAWPTCGACGCYKDKRRCVGLRGPCKVHEHEHGETKGSERQGRRWGGNGDLVIEPVDEEVAAWLKMRRSSY